MNYYNADERRAAGRKLAKARATADELTRIAKVMAASAADEGTPERDIAEQLGITRQTLRQWLGKRS